MAAREPRPEQRENTSTDEPSAASAECADYSSTDGRNLLGLAAMLSILFGGSATMQEDQPCARRSYSLEYGSESTMTPP